MIIQRFLVWVRNAPAGARAEATSALARSYLYSDLADTDRDDAETALTSMLDDPSPLVRRAIAEAFASSRAAPRHCVAALARDQSDIASIVLARSPLLTDADLVDCAAVGDVFAQSAVALRPRVSAEVAAALTEIGYRETLISLAVNPAAELSERVLLRMIERFGDDGETREAILSREALPTVVRAELARATAASLASFVVARDWMPEERVRRMTRESVDQAAILIATENGSATDAPDLDLARSLRRAGLVTPVLALRAALSGAKGFVVALLSELSGLSAARVAGLVNRPSSAGFQALYARAKLPPDLAPAFRAALEPGRVRRAGRLSRAGVRSVRATCETAGAAALSPALAGLLRQFEVEAAREAARRSSLLEEAARSAAPPPLRPARPVIAIDLAAIEAEILAA